MGKFGKFYPRGGGKFGIFYPRGWGQGPKKLLGGGVAHSCAAIKKNLYKECGGNFGNVILVEG